MGQDAVLAADEAVSNAIDHACPGSSGTLTLFAACSHPVSVVRIVVSDHGLWRPPQPNPACAGGACP
ncbi:anti-sigma regulatory factor (Ser/Thr protein kinase) [Kibdelosporangium phytohabitans]|nr:anti-sigma regulatory factor (Ser/Thr protein kinase) [Kibdelosporangium phytohabitans]